MTSPLAKLFDEFIEALADDLDLGVTASTRPEAPWNEYDRPGEPREARNPDAQTYVRHVDRGDRIMETGMQSAWQRRRYNIRTSRERGYAIYDDPGFRGIKP